MRHAPVATIMDMTTIIHISMPTAIIVAAGMTMQRMATIMLTAMNTGTAMSMAAWIRAGRCSCVWARRLCC